MKRPEAPEQWVPPRRYHSPGWLMSIGLLAMVLSLSCVPSPGPSEPRVVAEFGIFYGGQVQERLELPLEVDSARQSQGFRLRMHAAPEQPLEVRWEVGMPGAGRKVTDSQGRRARSRKVQLGRARWRAGEEVFEHALAFTPGDPLGLWNIRILVGDRIVLERPFFVYDREQRARRVTADRDRDGGL